MRKVTKNVVFNTVSIPIYLVPQCSALFKPLALIITVVCHVSQLHLIYCLFLTIANMFVVCAAVSCRETVIGAVTFALCQPLLPTPQLCAFPLLS